MLYVVLTLVASILGACKLIVEPGEGGSVSLLSDGSGCLSGETCEFDTDQGFFDTLIATPEEGFEFYRWVGYGPCEEDTTGLCEVMLETMPDELAQLLSAAVITLQAQFKQFGVNYEDSVNYGGVNYNYTLSAPLDSAMMNFYIRWEKQIESRDSGKEGSSI